MQSSKLAGGLPDKPIEFTRFPKFPSARILGINSELGCYQDSIAARSRNLRRHLLTIKNITSELCKMSMEKYNDDAGTSDVEIFRDVKQNSAFAVSLVLPVDAARP